MRPAVDRDRHLAGGPRGDAQVQGEIGRAGGGNRQRDVAAVAARGIAAVKRRGRARASLGIFLKKMIQK